MRPIPTRLAAVTSAVVAALLPVTVLAQTSPTTDERLQRLEARLAEVERAHAADLKARDAEIARLRDALATRPAAAPSAPVPPTTAPASPPTTRTTALVPPEAEDEIERTRREIIGDIEARKPTSALDRVRADMNPQIAVVSDFTANYSSNRNNDALNRVDVREIELDFRAAVDPRADAVAILAFERDAENPVFPGDEPAEGPEGSVNIEEAYLYLHDFGVPNLTAKLGRFHVRFGRQNVLHLHDLPTSDPPLVNQAFMSPESLSDAGVSFSYLVPPRLVGGQAIELVAEVLAGEGAGSESPTFTGDLSVDSPAFNVHALWNVDVGRGWNLELGGSVLTGPRGADSSQRATLYGFDATLVRRDPTGRFDNSLIQAELIYGDVDQEDGGTQHALGGYLLGQQQLNRDVYVGLRLDYTQDPNADDREAYGFSPYVSWYWSEFLRFRLQYQYKAGDVPTENTVFLQATWIFGAHPPHPYWAMK